MKLAVLLHFYQPPNQQEDILNRIVNECYIPLTRTLLNNPRAKLVINISGCLTELLLEKGYDEVINNMKILGERGQVEFTGSAKYHAFLPLLPKEEIERQVLQNNETNGLKLGKGYLPKGFFSPEMAVNDLVVKTVADAGFEWMAVPELSVSPDEYDPAILYKGKDTSLYFLLRNKRVSSLLLSGMVHSGEDLKKETTDMHETYPYFFAVMDAETFGHHRIGHEKVLLDVLNHPFFEPVTASELLASCKKLKLKEKEINIRASTWTNQEQDFWLDKEHTKQTEAQSFILWKDPSNPIHKVQWQLLDFVVNEVNSFPNKDTSAWKEAREKLDKALASDQFWWASAKPWWSLEMIEQGAYELKEVLSILHAGVRAMTKKEMLYRVILNQAFDWQRTGYIRKKQTDNSSTYLKKPLAERTPDEWFNQLILEFEDEMKKSAEARDFEKAIKWRDALLKIEQGTDIYDVLHVVDELWTVRTLPAVKPFLSHDWNEFSEFAKAHFHKVPTKEEFEKWQKVRGFR